jgi:hypothetical protein
MRDFQRVGVFAVAALWAGCSGGGAPAAGGGSGGDHPGGGAGGASETGGAGGTGAPPMTCAPAGARKTIRVYVAGESIEERNRFVAAPFNCDGTLNDRGADRNDNEEYGWMVPLAARLQLRDARLAVEFVGSGPWSGADDSPYSGTWPSATPGRTSAIAGTDIVAWLDEGSRDRNIMPRRRELEQKTHCYDVALAARGGNDLNQEVSDADYKDHLKTLVRLLLDGSSCRADPIVVVTAHSPDRTDVPAMDRLFQRLSKEAVMELKADATLAKRDRIRHADAYGAFKSNQPTKSQPRPAWFNGSAFDLATIGREGDTLHPRRLASIYLGEVVADSLDLAELNAL